VKKNPAVQHEMTKTKTKGKNNKTCSNWSNKQKLETNWV